MIIMHELPLRFVEYEGFKLFDFEKAKTIALLEDITIKVSITTDMWTSSNKKKGYMVMTTHFIDNSWTLRNPILRIEAKAQASSSIYDHLKAHGLPIGILPKGITEYYVDPTSGFFQINLTEPCDAKFENQFHYDFNISGYLSMGKIGELSGVSQQELFLWFPVRCIRVDDPSSGLIYFDVGVVDKQFSLSLFEDPRDCTAADPDDHSSNGFQFQDQFVSLGHEIGRKGILRADS